MEKYNMPDVRLIAVAIIMLLVGMGAGYEIAYITLQPQISDLQTSSKILEGKISVLKVQLTDANDKLNATKARLIEAETKLADAESQIASLNSSLQALAAPAVKVLSYRLNVSAGGHFVVTWKVTGGTPGRIDQTAVHWGNQTGDAGLPSYGFPKISQMFTGDTPQSFQTDIAAPLTTGPLYFRAHAVVDGKDVWSDEKTVNVTLP